MKVSMISAALLLANSFAHSQQTEEELFDLSLEELMNIEIVSASKKAESLLMLLFQVILSRKKKY